MMTTEKTIEIKEVRYFCEECDAEAHEATNFFVREKCWECGRPKTCAIVVCGLLIGDRRFEATLSGLRPGD